MHVIAGIKDTLGRIAAWAKARLWHVLALAFVAGLGVGALI